MRLLLVIAALLFSTAAYAQDAATSVITTSGRSQAQLRPTAAQLRLGIETRAASASLASSDNGARQQRIADAMLRQGLKSDQVQLLSFTVRAKIKYETQELLGYEAEAEVAIDLGSLDRIGMVIDSSLSAGATEVRDVDFTSDSLVIVRERLLAEAVASARKDAEVLARASGGRLGRMLSVSTVPCTGDRMVNVYGLQRATTTATSIAAMTPGMVRVEVAVCTQWEFLK